MTLTGPRRAFVGIVKLPLTVLDDAVSANELAQKLKWCCQTHLPSNGRKGYCFSKPRGGVANLMRPIAEARVARRARLC